ncbi:hypothetical protein [uncultured Chitinophaga sp.]|jgi:hypothetical protein|uniref:hypothetical protein n=1 Tax=uncultured Chitinophaga sp. TaxID=339340 RepID=UPI002613571F|nr:hypothetical protein [uncultured Chitinophaga sp.]
MYPSFSYPELQKRFCEGFDFFPFRSLEQHGGFIYKCYVSDDDTRELLDRYSCQYDNSVVHARVLLVKLQQNDIPVAGELLFKLQTAGYRFEERFHSLKRKPAVYRQLLETMETYHRILAVYQHDVQQHIAAQLAAAPETEQPSAPGAISTDNIQHLKLVVQEFLRSTDIIYTFLEGCVQHRPDYRQLVLTRKEQICLQDILLTIIQLRNLQKDVIGILKQWKQDAARLKDQRIWN